MEFFKKIVRGILAAIDMSATVISVIFVLLVLGMFIYNAMYWTALGIIGTGIAVYFISKKYHGV